MARRGLVMAVATVGAGAAAAGVALGRARHLSWGASAEEVSAALPGDDLLPVADLIATRAITVRSPASGVWPWLAQLGQGRGGFYSYDWLENLFGCQVRSATRIEPQWQAVRVDDDFRLHPEVALRVALVEPERCLVVMGADDPEGGSGSSAPYAFTWSFVLVPVGDLTTRLVVRERYQVRRAVFRPMVEVLAVVSFVMTERMLRGVRDRAEGMISR